MDYLQQAQSAHPEAAREYGELNSLAEKRLWHQLGVTLLQLTKHPFFRSDSNLVQLYENFVAKQVKNLNTLVVAQFAVTASAQIADNATAIAFIESVMAKVEKDKKDQAASLVLQMEIARRYLRSDKLDQCKALLEKAQDDLTAHGDQYDNTVHSTIYLTALQYYKLKGPASDYYRDSMLYLSYTPLAADASGAAAASPPALDTGFNSTAAQLQLASDVGLAALLSDSIYNFGELLQHPVSKLLAGTEYEPLIQLLVSCNTGNVDRFLLQLDESKKHNAAVAAAEGFLTEKIRIMTLMEMVFQRPSDQRSISFAEIASACRLDLNKVELLLMKSFSLNVLKGIIDEVAQSVRFTWVQPRVLDVQQIAQLRERVRGWSERVTKTARFIEDSAPEILHKPAALT